MDGKNKTKKTKTLTINVCEPGILSLHLEPLFSMADNLLSIYQHSLGSPMVSGGCSGRHNQQNRPIGGDMRSGEGRGLVWVVMGSWVVDHVDRSAHRQQWSAIPAKVDPNSILIPGKWCSIQFQFQTAIPPQKILIPSNSYSNPIIPVLESELHIICLFTSLTYFIIFTFTLLFCVLFVFARKYEISHHLWNTCCWHASPL